MKKHLVIIPGRGDNAWAYKYALPFWRDSQFKVQVFNFGWKDKQVPLEDKMQPLIKLIDSLEGDVYLVGASAGGTAAINALKARPKKITGIVTICSPLRLPVNLFNKLLQASIREAEAYLAEMPKSYKKRILSITGIFDEIVFPRFTKSPDVAWQRIGMGFHAPIIGAALTLYRKRIMRFFSNR